MAVCDGCPHYDSCDYAGEAWEGSGRVVVNCERDKEESERKTAKMPELLPCPFCGNVAYDHASYNIRNHKPRHIVQCTKCNAMMEYRDKKSATKAWNTRKPTSNPS